MASLAAVWNRSKGWFDQNFTWKGVLAGLLVLYQLLPDTAGRNQYWIAMYPQIRDFIMAHLRVVLIVIGLVFIWLDHRYTLAKHHPAKSGFNLTVDSNIWLFDSEKNKTLFILSGFLVNTGEPSIAKDWRAEYEYNGTKEQMEMFYIKESYTVDVSGESLTVDNRHLLNAQTIATRIEKGEGKVGRLFFSVPGDRSKQIPTLQFKITVYCNDYANRATSAMFKPSPVPLTALKMFPGEIVKSAKVVASQGPQLVPGGIDKP